MKISECAELTGVSVRTIRFYHQVGLLPVPESDGYREYSMSHVARILRVRWLAGAGLSLDAIGSMVDDDLGSGLADLEEAAKTLDERIDELTIQRQRVAELIESVKAGETSPVTTNVRSFYDRVMARLETDEAKDLVRWEMRLAELFSLRGLIEGPKKLDALMATLDDEAVERAASFYTRFALLPSLEEDEAEQLSDELVDDLLSWATDNELLTEETLRLIPSWGFTSVGQKVVSGFLRLLAPHRRQADLLDRVATPLLKEPHDPRR